MDEMVRKSLMALLSRWDDERLRHNEAATECREEADMQGMGHEADMNEEAARIYGQCADQLREVISRWQSEI